MTINTKSVIVGFAVGGMIGALTFASAASLGDVQSGTLGSGVAVVAACDDAITVTWPAVPESPAFAGSANVTASTFLVDRIRIADVAAECEGNAIRVSIADAEGKQIGSATGTVELTDGVQTLTMEDAPVDTRAITQVVLSIFDDGTA